MKTKKFHITIPSPPSINHAYRYINNRKTRTEETKRYDALVKRLTVQAMEEQGFKMFPDKTKLRMEMTYYFPDNRIRDTHNSFKIPLDSMEKLLYPNDYWVLLNIKDFIIDRENPRVEIDIYIQE